MQDDNLQTISFNDLPMAVTRILSEIQELKQKIDGMAEQKPQQDDDRFVGINEICKLVFPQWKRQTLYNKCSLGEIPHSRIGSRLMFNVKECIEWRDSQLQLGRIKSINQLSEEAQAFLDRKKGGLR